MLAGSDDYHYHYSYFIILLATVNQNALSGRRDQHGLVRDEVLSEVVIGSLNGLKGDCNCK